jgi:outer membrane protein
MKKNNKNNMKKVKQTAIFLCLLLFGSRIYSQQNSNAYSLQQAIDYAMKNSPNMVNANNDIIAAKYRKREIAGVGYPQLNASFDLKDFFKIPVSVLPNFVAPSVYQGIVSATGGVPEASKLNPDNYSPIEAQFGTKFQANASASLSQIIFSSDYLVALQAAKYLEQIGTLNANRSKADVIAGVSKAYYTVLVNKERLKLLNSNVERLKKLFDDTKAYNLQGFVELIDVERLEVTYNNLISEKEKVERLMMIADAALRFQMGYSADAPITLTDSLPFSAIDQELPLTKADATNRPEYQLLKSSQELNVLNLKRHKLGYLPTVVAYGSGGYTAFRNEFDIFKFGGTWYPTLVLGGTISLNIFDGLQRHNRIQQAKLELGKSQQNLNQIQQVVELETVSSVINLNNALTSLKAQSRNKDLATHVQDVAQKKYLNGVGSNIEVVTAEAALREAETNYYNAVYDMLVAKIDYQKATGTLIK